jgi:hypothetical protein
MSDCSSLHLSVDSENAIANLNRLSLASARACIRLCDRPLMVSRGHKFARGLDLGRLLKSHYCRFQKNPFSEHIAMVQDVISLCNLFEHRDR